jgi:hypothetical protein
LALASRPKQVCHYVAPTLQPAAEAGPKATENVAGRGKTKMSSFTAIVSILAAAAAVTFAITAYVN